MRRGTKIWIIAAASLCLIGSMIFGGAMTMLKWDFTRLSTLKYENNVHMITEEYRNIRVETATADIVFLPSTDGTTTVECREQTKMLHSVSVKDGTLAIELADTREWYDYISINFGSPKITVRIPAGEYGALSVKHSTGNTEIAEGFRFESMDISGSTGHVKNRASVFGLMKIKASTGDIRVENIAAGSLDLAVSTGRVTVRNAVCTGDVSVKVSTGKTDMTGVRCASLISNGSTGEIDLTDVIAAERISICRSTGDIEFERCDAAQLHIKTDTGDVEGTLLSEKIFMTKTDTGRISVPRTTSGGVCEIETDTGDIEISISE